MVLKEHASLSACASAVLVLATGSWPLGVAFWVGGTLVDLDHLHDYWRDDGFNLDLPRFFSYFRLRGPHSLLLALHSWEWVSALLALCLSLGAPVWVWGFGLGWLFHLCLDQRHNHGQNPLCYFFTFRLARGFRAADFYGSPR